MGLVVLIAGLVLFLGAHTFVTAREARTAAIARLGKAYWLVFALVSLAGVVLIAYGFYLYRAGGYIEIWSPPRFMRHIAIGLMLPAIILITAAYLPGHIKAWAKHPMLAGVKLWAFAHFLANGDLGSLTLFGAFLAWGVYARIAVKKREARGEVTTTRAVDRGWTNDIIAVALGTVIYLAFAYVFHPVLIGVPVFGV
ncbi:MAG: NnrU family protein [Pseudolabrys sp.]|nr:NnrU family protein [Pseudolabrys sp.]